MQADIKLVARTKRPEGGYAFEKVEPDKRGKWVRPEDATTFYLRYSDPDWARARGKKSHVRVEPVGSNFLAAVAHYQNRHKERETIAARIAKGLPVEASVEVGNHTRIADAVQKYESELYEARELWKRGSLSKKEIKSPNTVRRYLRFVRQFRDTIGVEYFDELTGDKIRAFKSHLRSNTKGPGAHDRIVADSFQVLTKFLSMNNVQLVRAPKSLPNDPNDKGLIGHDEFPALTKAQKRNKKAEKYSEKELAALAAAATPNENDVLQTFLRTGMRRNEVGHFTWDWIDWEKNRINISDQPRFEWRLKDYDKRWTPLSLKLKGLLKARRDRLNPKPDGLVFPTVEGRPDDHLDTILKRVAKRACKNGFTFKGKVELHRFRKTWATALLKTCSINDVRHWGGWSDLTTLQIYLADSDDEGKSGHKAVDAAFGD